MSSNRRVVVTGMGVITPVGNDLQTFWNNLVNGVSGIGLITQFDATTFDCKIAGEVRNFEAVNYFKDKKGPKRTDRFVHLAVAAAKLAMQDAGFDGPVSDPERFGCIVGSGIGVGICRDQRRSATVRRARPGTGIIVSHRK